MRIKPDENLSRHLKAVIAPIGHDVETVADEDLLGSPDAAIAAAAVREERMLFTLDTRFVDLRTHQPGTHPGICPFRPRLFGPLFANRMVERFVRTTDLDELAGCLVVVEAARVRIRRPS